MPLTLEQYAAYLDTRDLPWPAPPEVDRPKAKPHLVRLPQGPRRPLERLRHPAGHRRRRSVFQHPNDFIMNMALDKTIQEFKMWASMSRKPGQPSEYMKIIYEQVLDEQQLAPPGEKHPEVAADRLWEAILKKLLPEGLQVRRRLSSARSTSTAARSPTSSTPACRAPPAIPAPPTPCATSPRRAADARACWPTASGLPPCSCSAAWRPRSRPPLDEVIPGDLRTLSYEVRGRKPSERLFRPFAPAAGRAASAPTRCCTSARAYRRTSCRPGGWACARPCSPATGPRCRPPPNSSRSRPAGPTCC